jgi:hypothetical protein
MRQLRTSRWRRTLVAACLPYLLLSVFVDFVHLHPLLDDATPQISATNHVAPCPAAKAFDSPCAICQWLRAGTGLQPAIEAGPSVGLLPDAVSLGTTTPRGSPVRLLVSPRGPPFPRFA